MYRGWIISLLTLSIVASACTTPSPEPAPVTRSTPPAPTDPPPATEAPTPTLEPTTQPVEPSSPLHRDPATDADRANAAAIQTADLPIGDLRELAIRLTGLPADTPDKTCTQPREYEEGDVAGFKTSNSDTFEQFEVTATLVVKLSDVYMWVDNNWLTLVSRDQVAAAAREFNDKIIPRNRQLFGREWSPGIDCDPRLYVLYTSNTGTAGYFSSTDEYVRAARRDSNEHEMFILDLEGILGPDMITSSFALGVLAHEYQHMIHFYIDRNEDSWANEGLADLAMFLNGYDVGGHDFMFAFAPDTQLNLWPEGFGGENYGASFTFWLYFYDKYGETGISRIMADQRNGLDGVAEALRQVGYQGSLDDFFADWVIAKFLDDPTLEDGRFGFRRTDPPLAELLQTVESYPAEFTQPNAVNQYAAQYAMLRGDRDVRVEFIGQTRVGVIDAQPHSGQHFWWSNRGDYANMRLTREVDLTGVSQASLTYWTWFDLEGDWDYGYATVSEDGGQNYKTLETPSGTDRDPNENNLGWGYTGQSGGALKAKWIQEKVDLTPYAGKKILLRFEVVNDLAVNLSGYAIDDIVIPEIGFKDDAESDAGWTSEGWVRTSGFVPQNFIVQLIGYGKNGKTTVARLPVSAGNTGAWDVPLSQLRSAVIVFSATAVKTSEPARYNWSVKAK